MVQMHPASSQHLNPATLTTLSPPITLGVSEPASLWEQETLCGFSYHILFVIAATILIPWHRMKSYPDLRIWLEFGHEAFMHITWHFISHFETMPME